MLTEKQLDTADVTLHYVEGPASGVPLVLLHPATSRWQTFLPVIPLLGWRYHLYAPDLRGHGRSGRTPGRYRNGDYAQDLIELLRQRVGEPAVLLGHSLGGSIAIQVAAEAPALVRALILEEPALHRSFAGLHEDDPIYQLLVLCQEIAGPGSAMAQKLVVLKAKLPEQNEVMRREWAQSLDHLDPAMIPPLLDRSVGEGFDLDAALAQIRCPVLLLQGNPTVGGRADDEVARTLSLLAQAMHVQLPELGHEVHEVQPLMFCQLVFSFLEGL